jgi:FkbM family methyltransferase
MLFFQKKLDGINKRFQCARYGMFYFLNKDYSVPSSLLINGEKVNLNLKDSNINEFEQICLYDCYHLAFLKKKLKSVNTIVDIGANHGLFLIAARQHFSKATVICYEPNIKLKESLSYNSNQLNAEVHYEAVMKNDCMVDLSFAESDLATKTFESKNGVVPGVSFNKLIQRTSAIDILKLDCEGAEWELLESGDCWKNIKAVTMEYHSIPGKYNYKILLELFRKINYNLIHHKVITENMGLVVAINNAASGNK